MLFSATDRPLWLLFVIAIAITAIEASVAAAATKSIELIPEDMAFAKGNLRTALAAPDEEAFLQILLTTDIVRDPAIDTAFVYDVVVRFDPKRYRNMHAGLYALSFEDQFILWGKRIAMYSRSTDWESGRFHLHDISTGKQAWIYTGDARRLFQLPNLDMPPATPNRPDTLDKWLRVIHRVPATTSLRKMGRWIRLLRFESRDAVVRTGG